MKHQNKLSPKTNNAPETAKTAQEHYDEGRRLWALGRRGEAMTEYNRAIALDPKSPAVTALKMANEIMDFFDPSQFNP